MKISYAITVCNELIEIHHLLNFLINNKRKEDNIVVLYDELNGDPKVEEFLRANSINGEFIWHKGKFENHFADWKNKLNSFCDGDYIFQIDADESPSITLIESLPFILENNESDIILVPRINTLQPQVTADYIKKWGWKMNDKG